jgi:RHS repeat-associated protein
MKIPLCLLALIIVVPALYGQSIKGSDDVLVSMTASATWGSVSSTAETASVECDALQNLLGPTACKVSVQRTAGSQTPRLNTRLLPGATYAITASIDNGYDPSANGHTLNTGTGSMTLTFAVPDGYVLALKTTDAYGIDPYFYETNVVTVHFNTNVRSDSALINVILRPNLGSAGLAPGMATSLRPDKILWQLSLGLLRNGQSAGMLALDNQSSAALLADMASRSCLATDAISTDVDICYEPDPNVTVIRQISAPQVFINITGPVTNGNALQIDCYAPSQRSAAKGSDGYYTFSGTPYLHYLIFRGTSDADGISISCTAVPSDPNRTLTTTIQRTGTAPAYKWVAEAWHTGLTAPITVTRDRTYNPSNSDIEALSIQDDSGSVALRSIRTYTPMDLTEELTSESSDGASAISAQYNYYSTDPQSISFGRLKTISRSDGGWEGFQYDGNGNLATVDGPFNNSDIGVPANYPSHNGVKVNYTYSLDPLYQWSRAGTTSTTIGGTATGSSSTTYTDSEPFASITTHPHLVVVTAVRNDSSDSTHSLSTVTKYFSEAVGVISAWSTTNPALVTDDFFRNLPYSVQYPNGTKESYEYQRGIWDGASFTPSANAGLDQGTATRTIVFSGSANSTAGSLCASYGSAVPAYPIDNLYLVDGKSTMQITIRDSNADIVHVESQVWSSGTWNLVAADNYTYNAFHQVVNHTSSNGSTWSAVYSGELKTDETDETGVHLSYTYDAANRVDTVTRDVPSNTVAAIITKFFYDAAGHEVKRIVGYGGAESMTYSQSYDTSGRIVSRTTPGPNSKGITTNPPVTPLTQPRNTVTSYSLQNPLQSITTSYSYDPSNRLTMINLPNGGTQLITTFADGNVARIEGSSVVARYFSYLLEADGSRHTVVHIGSSSSTRLVENWADWLGRKFKTSRPGFTGQPAYIEFFTYDPATGQLTSSSRTGYADTLYEYDALGSISRSGLHLGSGSKLNLGSADRIVDNNTYIEKIGSAWWITSATKTYPYLPTANSDQSNTAITLRINRQRLTAFPSGVVNESLQTDLNNNTLDRTVSIDPTTGKVSVALSASTISNVQTEVYVDGLPISVNGTDGITRTIGYDSLRRKATVLDPRTGTETLLYKPYSTFLASVQDAVPNTVISYGYDDAGRTTSICNATNKYTYFDYNDRDQLVDKWGDTCHRVTFGFDPIYGDRTAMQTYRTNETADWTVWKYDEPSGLVNYKYDAANLDSTGSPIPQAKCVSWTYNLRGQLDTRTWARGISTTYGYDPATGELTGKNYSDQTTPIVYSYTRTGQPYQIKDGTGTRTYNYGVTTNPNPGTPVELDSITLSSFFGGRTLTLSYDSVHRESGFKVGAEYNSASDISQIYSFDPSTGKFANLQSALKGQSATEFDYTYTDGLLSGMSVLSSPFAVSYAYEPHRDLRTKVDTHWNAVSLTRYDYTYNTIGQRQTAKQSSDMTVGAFSDLGDATTYNLTYDSVGELVDAADYMGSDVTVDSSQLSGRHFAYSFDGTGNRTTVSRTGSAGVPDAYVSNSLNQYSSRTNNYTHTAGTVAKSSAIITVTGSDGLTPAPVARQGNYWDTQFTLNNANGPATAQMSITATWPGHGPGGVDLSYSDNSHRAQIPPVVQNYNYDDDGNLSDDGIWSYTYDAENRLVGMTSDKVALDSGYSTKALSFTYDFQGRRVQKRVFDQKNQFTEIYSRRYLYAGDNLVGEFDAAGGNTCGMLLHSYAWGLDIRESLSATGGVGALVAITDYTNSSSGTTYYPTYDGNGNVASIVNAASGVVAASYEYSPAGELLRCAGVFASANPFRFSTKYTDDETEMVYFGLRYYSPGLGRFINRDPIAEAGGVNMYGFCANDPLNSIDRMGLFGEEAPSLAQYIVNGAQTGSEFGPEGAAIGAVVGLVLDALGFGGLFGAVDAPPEAPKIRQSNPTQRAHGPGYVTGSDYPLLAQPGEYYPDLDSEGYVKGWFQVSQDPIKLPAFEVAVHSEPQGLWDSWLHSLLSGVLKYTPVGYIATAYNMSQSMVAQYHANLKIAGNRFNAINMTVNPAYLAMSGFYEGATGIGLGPQNLGEHLSGWQRAGSYGKGVIGTVGTVGAGFGAASFASNFIGTAAAAENGAASATTGAFEAGTSDEVIDTATQRAMNTLDKYGTDLRYSNSPSASNTAQYQRWGWTNWAKNEVTLFPEHNVVTLIEEAHHIETAAEMGWLDIDVAEQSAEQAAWRAEYLESAWEQYADSIGIFQQ